MPSKRPPAYDPGFGLAENLTALMKERNNMTDRALGRNSGVSPSQISSIRRGLVTNPGAYIVYRLALALRVPMEELMGVSRLAARTRMREWGDKTVAEMLAPFSEPEVDSQVVQNDAGG